MSTIKTTKLGTVDGGYVQFRMDRFESLEYFGPESGVSEVHKWLLCSVSGVNYHLSNAEGDKLNAFIESGGEILEYQPIKQKTLENL